MALTRKLLKSLGLEEAQIETIIDAHTETVDGLKETLKTAQTEAAKVEELTKQLNDANDNLAKAGDADTVKKEFEDFKAQVAAEKKAAQTAADVDALLKEAGIARDSFRAAVAKSFDPAKLIYAEDGSISNRAELLTSIKADYADFLAAPTSGGTEPITPPTGGSTAKMSKDEISALPKDQRRAAIIANLDQFRN